MAKKQKQGPRKRCRQFFHKAGKKALKAAAHSPGYLAAGAGIGGVLYGLGKGKAKVRELFGKEFVQDRADVLQHSANLQNEAKELADLVVDNLAKTLHLPRMDTVNNRLIDNYNRIVTRLESDIGKLRSLPGKVGNYTGRMQRVSEQLQSAQKTLESFIQNERSVINQIKDTLEAYDQLQVTVYNAARNTAKKAGVAGYIDKLAGLRKKMQKQDQKYLDQFIARLKDLAQQKENIHELKAQLDAHGAKLRETLSKYEQNVGTAEEALNVYIAGGELYRSLQKLKLETRSYSPEQYNRQIQAKVDQELSRIMTGAKDQVKRQVAKAVTTALVERRRHYEDMASLAGQKWVARADSVLYAMALIGATACALAAPYINTAGRALIGVGKLGVGAVKGTYNAGTGLYRRLRTKQDTENTPKSEA